MFTILKKIWDSFEPADNARDNFNRQTEQLETIIYKQECQNIVKPLYEAQDEKKIEKSDYYNGTGIITLLKDDHGILDNNIIFDTSVGGGLGCELRVGSRVRYMAYKDEEGPVKVFKITEVLENCWDESGNIDEETLRKQVDQLKLEKPDYFAVHQRNILGLIVERAPDSIVVDTDYKVMTITLESVEISFVPQEGDRVLVHCNVQNDDKFLDKQGEILEEIAVHPARLLKKQRCTVTKIKEGWAVLNRDCYLIFDVSPEASKLRIGDSIIADMVECERGNFVWRCIKFETEDMAYSDTKAFEKSMESQVVKVSSDVRHVFSGLHQKVTVEFTIENNTDEVLKVLAIEFFGKRQIQIKLIDKDLCKGFDIKSRSSVPLRFECESLVFGNSHEFFLIQFHGFRIKRSINLTVCGSEEEAAEYRQRVLELPVPMANGRSSSHRSRFYAHSVWGRKCELVSGVGIGPKRRFIKHRIPPYDVPKRLKEAYLTSRSKNDMTDGVETYFPSVKEELTARNYVTKFQVLLHLEEIEYFVTFRNYDMERAHFTRVGEYLSLVIENLAERRPSLVLGDTVHASNPWELGEPTARTYEGSIHKVLFDRIYLKFNASFQNNYNGEDYRLEFFFSRYGFRKQHHSIVKAVTHLGEDFLFPTRIKTRPNAQLAINLNADDDLILEGKKHDWVNSKLNSIQKRAVYNILRGEAYNMPYIIFGPPGTGKTVTLIETIIQIIKLIPHARILVGTPSNSSADIIATRLVESNALEPGDFVRLVSQNIIEKELIPDELLRYCATADIGIDGTCESAMVTTESGLKLRCQQKFLGRHKITVSTCTTLGNFMQMDFGNDHFTHVIIDEAGQCTEPEVMIPIAQISKGKGQVILAGDPNQLQPIVINRLSNVSGLARSFLIRILAHTPYVRDIARFPSTSGFDPRLVTKLLYSYRALPSILNVYNELFYNSELIPMVHEVESREAKLLKLARSSLPANAKFHPSHGAFFFGLRSENKQETDSPSWFNPLEAKQIFFRCLRLYRMNIQPDRIGIITPYAKQVKHLRNIFLSAEISMPKIGSVEEFQGQERDIILISTVRSSSRMVAGDIRHSLGFVRCSKRMNVAISRARYLLIVFGNPHLLMYDRSWRSYISYCLDNDAYDGCDLPEHLFHNDTYIQDDGSLQSEKQNLNEGEINVAVNENGIEIYGGKYKETIANQEKFQNIHTNDIDIHGHANNNANKAANVSNELHQEDIINANKVNQINPHINPFRNDNKLVKNNPLNKERGKDINNKSLTYVDKTHSDDRVKTDKSTIKDISVVSEKQDDNITNNNS
ncbi:probable RNA helicase armi [Teleopsis dalmanni]|uniref:probable RNA helicase armi n=1 Tax=Teleopsis dalmanni TaxID=139649 RepID=UPI000D32A2AF|nr:probable RNA helicase armi [Teleopsis dalmanni]